MKKQNRFGGKTVPENGGRSTGAIESDRSLSDSTSSHAGCARTRGLSKALRARVASLYEVVFRTVAANIRGKYRNILNGADAEDIASEALLYALNALADQDPESITEKGWTALAMFKARCLANSLHRHLVSGRAEALWLDASDAGEDRAGLEASCVVRASEAAWRDKCLDADRAELAARVYADLDGLYAKCGISTRAGKIFAAYYLRREPLEHVARRFGVTGNVVYVTAARVREKLAAYGPDFVSAA